MYRSSISIIAAILLSATCSVLMGNSGCGLAEGSCTFDTDCADSDACVQGLCLTQCQSDEDCVVDEDAPAEEQQTCKPYSDNTREETINVCATTEQLNKDKNNTNNNNTNNSTQCQSDQQCRDQLGNQDARCSLAQTCFLPRQEYALYIKDNSTQDSVTLLAAYLTDQSGQIIGYGVSDLYTPVGDEVMAEPLLGKAPSLREDKQCTQDVTKPSMPLGGKGGAVQLSFVTPQGQRLEIDPTWSATLITYNTNCDEEVMQVYEYSVDLCVYRSGEQLDPETHCTTSLGSGTEGVERFPLKTPTQ